MKNISIVLTSLLAAVLLFSSCAQPEYSIGTAPSKLEGIKGKWKLAQVKMRAEGSLIELNVVDLSAVYIGTTPMVIEFKSDLSYAITPGTTPNNLGGAAGTWAFDDPEYPTMVKFSSMSGEKELALNAPIRPQDAYLDVKFQGGCSSAAKYTYLFRFERAN